MQAPQSEYWETGVVTEKDVSLAQSETRRAWACVEDAQKRLSLIVKREQELIRLITKYDAIRQIRQLCDAWTTRVGTLAILLLTSTLNTLVVCHFLGVPSLFWAIPTLAVFSLASFCGVWLFRPADKEIDAIMDCRNRELLSIRARKPASESEVSQARDRFDKLQSAYQSVLKEFQSRINCLRTANWQLMQGVPFENFLADVFLEWGYGVET